MTPRRAASTDNRHLEGSEEGCVAGGDGTPSATAETSPDGEQHVEGVGGEQPSDAAVDAVAPAPSVRLTLLDLPAYQEPLACWPLPLEPAFVDSREFRLLEADIRRYVRGSVAGRSYLIAGHRGAGKSALVARAVNRISTGLLREAVAENPVDLPPGFIERPFLVKLHGPSMLEAGGGAGKCPAGEDAEPEVGNADASKVKDETGEVAATPAGGSVAVGAHAALVHIAIGLYRALSGEAATGFRAHALNMAGRPPGDLLELAAQVALELDGGATPAALRGRWSALGRLKRGVLWPATADATCEAHGMSDQGLREVAALATAAQAFQVCTGSVKYESKAKDSAVRTLTSELKGASDLKDVVGRMSTLGLGALTGVSILGATGAGATGAVAGGLAVWLLGSLSLSWSSRRTHTDDRLVDYSFIRDLSLATLERDLPIVITRVREAGLVPVFAIDELDKVPDAPSALADLIGRLKHLIADFGFFCFLVNRDCYDRIEARIRSGAYPTEHTLFSDRLLLSPDPVPALRYLIQRIGSDGDDPQFGLARATLALRTMHEARLNLTDMMRQLARLAKPGTQVIGTSTELITQPRLIIATVQLAINEVLRSDRLADRMLADPGFAQLAIDTLYDPSRSWSGGAMEVDPGVEALGPRLNARIAPGQPGGGELQTGAPPSGISPTDLELLQSHLVQLLDLLADLRRLRAALLERNASGREGDPEPGDVRLADIPPLDVEAICLPLDDGRYRFLFDRDGRRSVEDPGRLSTAQRARATELIAFADALQLLLEKVGVGFDDLARTPLLKTVSAAAVATAKVRLTAAMRRGGFDPEIADQLSVLERLHGEVQSESERLGELLILIASIRRDVENPLPVLPAITRLIRYDLQPRSWIRGGRTGPARALPRDAESLGRWTDVIAANLLAAPGQPDKDADEFQALVEPFARYFGTPRSDGLPVDYWLLLQASSGSLPGSRLTARLGSMTTGDWSALAQAAMPRTGRSAAAPFWLLVAGLRGLGFGRAALAELADPALAPDLKATGWVVERPGMTAEQCFETAARLAQDAPDRPPGIIVVEGGEERYGHERPVRRRPTLIIDRAELSDYLPALRWLSALGLLAGQAFGLRSEDRSS